MRTVVPMLWLCTGCAYITEDEYAHRMSGKTAPECAFVTQFYADTDEDGFGNPDVVFEGCEAPEGTVDNAEDCDDTDPDAYPGALRAVDEDGDGYGSTTTTVSSCLLEAGMSATADDCDDTDPAVNPGAAEDCSTEYDDDCSGSTNDENAAGCTDWYGDADADGFAGGDPICMCASTSTHRDTAAEDCDDGNEAVHPDALEVCNDGIDNNCDEQAVGCGFLGETNAETAAYQFTGAVSGAASGADLVYTADVTDDGNHDLLIGAYQDGAMTLVSGAEPGAYTTDDFIRLTGASGQNLGRDMVVPGDLDGDGVDDLILGAPSASFAGRIQAGTVNVYFGPFDDSTLLGTPDAQIGGGDARAYLGRNMGVLGDFDGDGTADILAGGFEIRNVSSAKVGAVYVVLGPMASGDELDGATPGDIDLIVYGESANDKFGSTMTAMGDWSGDGLPDFVVSARGAASGRGALYGFESGQPIDSEGSAWAASDADVIVDGVGNGAMTGEGLRFTDDVDGDGRGDLLVGAPRRNLDGIQRGAAYLLTDLATAGIVDVAAAEFRGQVDNAHFGTDLAALRSIGASDASSVAIAAPAAAAGSVYVFTGPFEGSIDQATAEGVVVGEAIGDGFGTALVGDLDFDEDGQSDLIIGAPGAADGKGRTYLLLGGGM